MLQDVPYSSLVVDSEISRVADWRLMARNGCWIWVAVGHFLLRVAPRHQGFLPNAISEFEHMPDKYASFAQLSASEPNGSYKIESRQMNSAVALIAPHAGRIERGTSEICKSVASDDLTYYLFEGWKRSNNSDLHITSARFDEPQGLAVATSAQVVITFHGQSGAKLFVNVGGRASRLCQTVIAGLTFAGYSASRQVNASLQGLDQNNICNRGLSRQGLQLEISRGLRDKLVSDEGEMRKFSSAIRATFQARAIPQIDRQQGR